MATLIPYIRRAKKIKQNDMARDLSVSPAYLCKIEKGIIDPTERFKKDCSAYLKTPVSELFPDKKVDQEKIEKLASKKETKSLHGPNTLWRYRQQKGIKQNDLSRTLGCSPSYLSKVEKGHSEPTADFRKKCAKALKIKESVLFPK
ncbi:MAG: helix-turn-helix domain-containing protein [Spirochaetota bacterium]